MRSATRLVSAMLILMMLALAGRAYGQTDRLLRITTEQLSDTWHPASGLFPTP